MNVSKVSTTIRHTSGRSIASRNPSQLKTANQAKMSTAMNLREYATLTNSATSNQNIIIHDAYEPNTGSWQYIVADTSTKQAAIVDPVLDYDAASATITTKTADSLLAIVKDHGYNVQFLLETHAHADHITAANYLKAKLGQMQASPPIIGIGKRIVGIQEFWARHFGVAEEEYQGVFDKLLEDNETFKIGSVMATAVHLPGHTPDHMGYLIGGTFHRASLHKEKEYSLGLQTIFLWAIQSSTPISGLHGLISLGGMLESCFDQAEVC